MIGYLEGRVLKVLSRSIMLVVGGVGYEVFPSGRLLSRCATGKGITCFIYTLVREQEISLYGFETLEERDFFETLIGISGVGPKLALKILNQPLEHFWAAIDRGDVDFVCQTPGIGKKMAQKLIVELKGKLDFRSKEEASPCYLEACEALKSLGYDEASIRSTLKEAPEGLSAEDLIKFFLSHQR